MRERTKVRFARWLAEWIVGQPVEFGVSVRVHDDDAGWQRVGGAPHDREDLYKHYKNTLGAWRKNPLARRAVAVTTDYVIGNGITLSSPNKNLNKFLKQFWTHPENNMPLRLEPMCDELTRSGDLFVVQFRNKFDGMAYIRFLTKDQIEDIETAKKDWEKELVFVQLPTDVGENGKRWLSPSNGRSKRSHAICLHYPINKPIGAKFGESDLSSVLPWLKKYSRMLEDRVRFHWATRIFNWIVTVPTNKVKEKAAQYEKPPTAGAVIVKDDSEEWEAKSPVIRGADASPDMKAVRLMSYAGLGFPPHWFGESMDTGLSANASQSMHEPAEKHLSRRQDYFCWILQDVVYHAYCRANYLHPDLWPDLETAVYTDLFTVSRTDISKTDNESLAKSAKDLSGVVKELNEVYGRSPKLKRVMLRLVLAFAGEPANDGLLDEIMAESAAGSVSKPEFSWSTERYGGNGYG